MKKHVLPLLFCLLALPAALSAQSGGPERKYALVIGNGNYKGITRLKNPENDAADMKAALEKLGWTVDLVRNGTLDQMERAVSRLKGRLSSSNNAYGFFFYAGHGVQSGGENYLIPVDANIQSENLLRQRAMGVQFMLDELNGAGNALNIVVLDACRDNPFGWSRSGSRGLSVVSSQPADSIIVYATSAGSTAQDGTGRNGLFTKHLLNNLKTPDLSIREVFDRTGADVQQASNRAQVPAIYSQFFGAAYLGAAPAPGKQNPSATPAPAVPTDAKAYYDRGLAYYDKKDYDRAIAEYTQAIKLDPNYATAYTNRGCVYGGKGDYDRAIADFTQAIKLDPNDAHAYTNRGIVYYYKKDYDRAITEYTQAIRLDPNDAIAYTNRGIAYYNKRDYDRAIAEFTQAIRLDPNDVNAYTNRGDSYYYKGNRSRARADWRKALRLDPNNAVARDHLNRS
jgi:tetratricopeptide (TPR) repeat protein